MPVRIQAHSGSCRCPTDSKKDAPRCHSDGTLFFARPKQNVGLGPGVSGRPSQLAWYSRVISPSTGISPEFYTRPALIYSLGQLSHFLRHSLLSPPSLGRRGRRHLFALPIERGEGAQSAGRPNVHPTASASGDCSGTNPDGQTVHRRGDHSSLLPLSGRLDSLSFTLSIEFLLLLRSDVRRDQFEPPCSDGLHTWTKATLTHVCRPRCEVRIVHVYGHS